MTSLDAIDIRGVSIPLPRPTGFSSRTVDQRQYLLVRIRCGDGSQGIGFCYVGDRGVGIAVAAVRELLGPAAVGLDADDIEGTWSRLFATSLLHGQAGTVMRCLSAIDIALWDRKARVRGVPLHKLLSGHSHESVPAYASGGYYFPGESRDRLSSELRSYVAAGFSAVKIKVGKLSPAEEVARVEAARLAVGQKTILMLDANNAFRTVAEALEFTRSVEVFDPYWIEEPFLPDDIESHARLAAATATRVATGELEAGHRRFSTMIAAGSASVIQPDAAVCGGITEYLKIAEVAHTSGVAVAPHWFDEVHGQLLPATPTGEFVEYFVGTDVFNFRLLVDTPLEVQDGRLRLSKGPGLGFDFKRSAVDAYAITEWITVT